MSAYSDLITGLGPSAYYRFGESSGTTLNATVGINGTYAASVNSVTGAVIGDSDTAVSFDGNTDGASVADDNSLDLGNSGWSVAVLFKRSATQGVAQALVRKVNAYEIRFTSTNEIELRQEGVPTTVANTTVQITDQNWHQLVVTRPGAGEAYFYLDGVNVTNFVGDATFANSNAAFRIGWAAAAARRFPGSLDELAVFKTTLTQAQALELYRTARGTSLTAPAVAITVDALDPAFQSQVGVPSTGITVDALNPSAKVGIGIPATGITVDALDPAIKPKIAAPAPGITVGALDPSFALPATRRNVPAISVVVDAFDPTVKSILTVPTAGITVTAHPPGSQAQINVPSIGVTIDAFDPELLAKITPPTGGLTVESPDPSIIALKRIESPSVSITVAALVPSVPQITGDTGANAGMRIERRIPRSKVEITPAVVKLEALPPGTISPDEIDELSLIMLLYG